MARFLHYAVIIVLFSVSLAQDNCIQTADEYWTAFDNAEEPRCVSPELMVTLQGPCDCPLHPALCVDTVSSSGPDDDFAWVSDHGALEDYLEFSYANPNDRWECTKEMLEYIGYPPYIIDQECTYRMILIDRTLAESDFGLFPPTYADWLQQIRLNYGLNYGIQAAKDVTLKGFLQFDELTGCTNRTVEPAGVCGTDFEQTRNLLSSSTSTAECMALFSTAYNGGTSASGAHLRGMLYWCVGANELNTGMGYGWDFEKFTGAEFVMDNAYIVEDLGSVPRDLWNPSSFRSGSAMD